MTVINCAVLINLNCLHLNIDKFMFESIIDDTHSIESSDDPNKTSTARALAALATDDLQKSQELGKEQSQQLSPSMNDYDPDNKSETETKSLSSVKSNGSNPDLRYKQTNIFFFIYFPFLV